MNADRDERTNGAYVGSPVKSINGDLFVTGRARFVSDINLPGTLHMAVLRSPHPHARIGSIDISGAIKATGVVKILTGADIRERLDPIPHYIDPEVYGGRHTDIHALAIDKVLCAGQPVAAVVADSKQNAQAALPLIKVDYTPLPHVLESEDALRTDAPRLVEEWDDNSVFRFGFKGGDVAKAFEEADQVIEGSLKIHRFSTQPIETRAYVAVYNRFDETLTLYGTAQNPHPLRNVLSTVLRFPENRIRIIVPNLGGAFGLKMHGHPEEPLVCLLAMLTGRPVKWVEDRSECLLIGGREQTHRFEVAFRNDGRVTGLRDDISGNTGAPAATPGWGMIFLTGLTMPCSYDIENMDIGFIAAVTNKSTWNASRGYGKEAANLVMERIMDMVAARLGMDPAEVRYRNFIPADSFPFKTIPGLIFDSGDYHETLRRALELIGYSDWRGEQRRLREQGRYIGVGIGYEVTPEGGALSGTFVAGYDTSTVKVDPNGKVTVLTGVTNPGGGNATGIAQVVADELGVDLSDIRVIQGDTDVCPYGFGNYSGRSMIVGGGSAALAAREIREKIAKVAGQLLNEDPQKLVFRKGRIHSQASSDSAGEQGLALREAAYAIYTRAYDIASIVEPPLEATRTYKPGHISHVPDEQGRINPYPSYSNGAYVAVVEVDVETGYVSVLKFAVVHDCGTVINPLLMEGQARGAIAMGIGAALGEEVVYGEDGQQVTTSFKEYLMPRAADIPLIDVSHHPSPSPFTLLGNKGAGESGLGGTQAAIVNAVADALSPFGVTIDELPLKPPRVWRMINEARIRADR
jgi:aerobic carbon-monoxide dehydrogenase large subunit